jgi:putative phage-type endonuclease
MPTLMTDKHMLYFSKQIPTPWILKNKQFLTDFIHGSSCVNHNPVKIEKRVDEIIRYKTQLERLKTLPIIKQKTDEWFETRKHILTASMLAQALGKSKYGTRQKLIESKAFPERAKVLYSMRIPSLHWGNMFEPMADRCYRQRFDDININEFGLVIHPDLHCFGASPDGINELGIMVEYKCPWKRIPNDTVPNQYKYQMLGQMATCGLEECDFVDCQFEKHYTYSDYGNLGNIRTNHGIIVEYGDSIAPIFDYSPPYMTPKETLEWLYSHKKFNNCLYHLWSLTKMNIHREYFDEHKWNNIVPEIKRFWNDVDTILEKRK